MKRLSLHTKLRRASRRGGAKRRAHPEDDLHIAIVDLFRSILRPGTVMAHIPNQGIRLLQYLQKLIRMGMKEGMADLVFFREGRAYFMEVKAPKGSLRPKQAAFRVEIEAAGFDYVVVKSIEEAVAAAQSWGLISPKFKLPTTENANASATKLRRAANGGRSTTASGRNSSAPLRSTGPETRGRGDRASAGACHRDAGAGAVIPAHRHARAEAGFAGQRTG